MIITPLPYLEEIGVKDGENAYILKFDCSNVDEIAKKISNKPKFKFKPLEDGYEKVFYKSKSKFTEEQKELEEVECIQVFKDCETGIWRHENDHWKTNKIRAEYLKSLNLVK